MRSFCDILNNTEQPREFSVYKTDDEHRLVFGWASVSITVEGEQLEDRQQDMIDPEDLEEAAYEYVLNFRDAGEEHVPTMRKKGRLVESCVFTQEKQKAMGIPEGILPVGWWIGFKIEDDGAWQRVKDGTYQMFSIEGRASREPVEQIMPLAKTFEEICKFNPFHDARGRFASARGFKTYSANPKSKAGAMAIQRSNMAGHGRTLNVHAESKGESIQQNADWLATGKKPKVPAATSRARYQQRKQKQQQNAAASEKITEKPTTSPKNTDRKPVDGKDISHSFQYDPSKGSALDQVAEQQGFKGKPMLESDPIKFSHAVRASGMIGYRTINDGTDVLTGAKKTSKQFADDLKNSDIFSHNGKGGQVYGGGLYIATTKNPVKGKAPTIAASQKARRESVLYGRGSHTTMAMTMDPSAKVGDYFKLQREFRKLNRTEQKKKYGGDIGAYAAAKGYDALIADVGGCNYMTVYNRSKLIIFDK